MLRYLDLRGNKIYALDSIDTLSKLKKLYSLNLENNPITVHLHLNKTILDIAPQIEVINSVRVRDLGNKIKLKIESLKQELTRAGD